jgi:hypothetical protein
MQKAKNVTLALDREVADWARVEAAKAGKSMSRWLGDRLRQEMGRETTREDQIAALKRFLAAPGWPGIAENLPSRDELYDRPVLRRHKYSGLRDGSRRSGKTR